MDEYQRQAYLSTLGIENYMPRWRLAIAPEPVLCVLPRYESTTFDTNEIVPASVQVTHPLNRDIQHNALQQVSPALMADVLRDLVEPKKNATNVTPNLTPEVSEVVEALPSFALSIWRPQADLLIIDARNPQLALPTELLLNNILRAIFDRNLVLGREEVLRWPMIENTAISRTIDDARNTLQVWLEVELEQRPVNHVLLFGKNSAQYLLPQSVNYEENVWQWLEISALSVQTLTAPSLVELLQQPLLKRYLWQCLTRLRKTV